MASEASLYDSLNLHRFEIFHNKQFTFLYVVSKMLPMSLLKVTVRPPGPNPNPFSKNGCEPW